MNEASVVELVDADEWIGEAASFVSCPVMVHRSGDGPALFNPSFLEHGAAYLTQLERCDWGCCHADAAGVVAVRAAGAEAGLSTIERRPVCVRHAGDVMRSLRSIGAGFDLFCIETGALVLSDVGSDSARCRRVLFGEELDR